MLLSPFGIAGATESSSAWPSLLAVAASGCLGTAAAFATLAARVGSARAAVTVYFVPIVAIVLGAAVRGEPVSWPPRSGRCS